MTGTASQFGADLSWVLREPELFRKAGRAEVDGLHLFMATNLVDEDALIAQFDIAAAAAEKLAGQFGGLAEVDLGGGFGAPYAQAGTRDMWPTLKPRTEAVLDRRLPGWRDGAPAVSFESGRYLAGDCGVLVCRVLDVKQSKGHTFAILDSGINHLGGMVGLRRLPPMVPTVQPATGNAHDQLGAEMATTVVGPLCTPLDSMLRNAKLPRMASGDLVVVPNIGAYGLTASLLGFLGHPAPIEIVCDGDSVLDASRLTITREGVR
jgi:diaminopimelate decarboxylase